MICAFINVSCKYNLYKLLEEKKNYNNFFEVLWNYKKNTNINYYFKKIKYTI